MISYKQQYTVIGILDKSLGSGNRLANNEIAYQCPFCHHHKKKLQINIETQKYHCWVCNARGKTLKSLLQRLNTDYSDIITVNGIYGSSHTKSFVTDDDTQVDFKLPSEYKPLWKPPKSFDPIYNNAAAYLKKRNIDFDLIIKYQIGYCENGLYSGRIIIPSYDVDNKLNYFIARTFYDDVNMSYKNPPISKNVIIFENQINWNEDIILVEGMFDALSVRRNVIPILGKFISEKLLTKLLQNSVKSVYLILDKDAVKQSTKHTKLLMDNGIKVTNIIPNEKDPGDMGFEHTIELIKKSTETNWSDLISTKLNYL